MFKTIFEGVVFAFALSTICAVFVILDGVMQ